MKDKYAKNNVGLPIDIRFPTEAETVELLKHLLEIDKKKDKFLYRSYKK